MTSNSYSFVSEINCYLNYDDDDEMTSLYNID